jgi:predicted enzyme related to lactoylglutathione lyase
VPDIRAATAAIREAGVPLVHEPHVVHRHEGLELWMAFLKDTEGNHLALMSEVPTAP